MDNLRSRLLDMVAARRPRTDLKTASLACGRNHAYLHQFIHKGSPRRLPEDVRLRLAHCSFGKVGVQSNLSWPKRHTTRRWLKSFTSALDFCTTA